MKKKIEIKCNNCHCTSVTDKVHVILDTNKKQKYEELLPKLIHISDRIVKDVERIPYTVNLLQLDSALDFYKDKYRKYRYIECPVCSHKIYFN